MRIGTRLEYSERNTIFGETSLPCKLAANVWFCLWCVVACVCLIPPSATNCLDAISVEPDPAAAQVGDRSSSLTAQGAARGVSYANLVAIENIRVGDRVLADNPDVVAGSETRVDPLTWRHLILRADVPLADGVVDDVHVESLQPPDWVKTHHAVVGAVVPPPLDLAEMGLPEDLQFRVVANKPCPPIRAGPGHVVLTTINHLNNDLRELSVVAEKGQRQTFRPTGLHKFFREPEGTWVSAKDLRPGDQIRSRSGLVTVVSNIRIPGLHRVYNLTVEGEHVYHVSTLGVLAHNNGCAQTVQAHHFWPRSWGNGIPYGHRILAWLTTTEHQHLHRALNAFLRAETGHVLNWGGKNFLKRYGKHGLNKLIHKFYRQYSRTPEGIALANRLRPNSGLSLFDLFNAEYQYAIRNGFLRLAQ